MGDSSLPSLFSLWTKVQEKTSLAERPSPQLVIPKFTKLNDMVYLVHEPPPEVKPELEVVFFHGLQLEHFTEPHVTTWVTRDNSQCWLQTWLVDSFPKARIFTVSYDASATKTVESGRMDMYQTGENLLSDLIAEEVGIGQAGCPVVLVGHCLGGLVLKELCLFAEMACRRKTGKPRAQCAHALFSNLKGMFFYGTPHTGSMLGDMFQDCFNSVGALAEEIEILKTSSTRRNEHFMELKSAEKWLTYGIGESKETFVQCIERYIHVVSEASTRPYMDEYYSGMGDHYEICKPTGKTDSTFLRLCAFLRRVQQDSLLERPVEVDPNALLPFYVDKEDRAKKVQLMLAESDTCMVCIAGLSGSGKTALAEQVYHKIRRNYDVACFVSLESIAAAGSSRQGILRKIQEELGNADRGPRQNLSSIILSFREKKVLLVLDNVESQAPLDALCISTWLQKSSSKIVVTTTNSSSIATTSPWLRSPLNTFKVPYLTDDESKDLFCHYAFNGGDGPADLKDYIMCTISKCNNYPLFIKILGACISKRQFKDKQLWKDLVTRLEEAEEVNAGRDERLWAKLRVCFDDLQASEKEIFLDVATIFHGYPLSLLKCIWKGCRKTSHLALQNLKEQFLVYDDKDNIKMHQHLRRLGKRIACPDGVDIDKWRWISGSVTANELINYHEGIVETLALELHPLKNEILTLRISTFKNYSCLQYLILEDVSMQGTRLELPRSLVYLRWKNGLFVVCPVDFTHLKNLVALEFLDCESMRSLPADVVHAQKLTWLKLEGCKSLMELPSGLPNCLELLGLNRTGLRRLPRDLWRFKNLTSLQANWTQLTRVPQWLDQLKMLQTLDLDGTKMTSLPESIRYLKCLEHLLLQHTKLSRLPESIGQLQNLERLELDNTPLEVLPDSIGSLQSLSTLNLIYTQLTTLPNTIGDLVRLRDFRVFSTKWRGFPESFRNLSGLDNVGLPVLSLYLDSEEVGDQAEESALDPGDALPQSGVHSFLSQLSSFQRVNHLHLWGTGCAESSLPALFSGLQYMSNLRFLLLVGFNLPEMIPSDIGKLPSSLEEICIQSWERLREVPVCLKQLSNLVTLCLVKLPQLCGLPELISALPSSVKSLIISECGRLLHCLRCGFSLERGVSSSDGTCTCPLVESLNLVSPSQLNLYAVCSDSWSILECFLECCGKHHAEDIGYTINHKELEKAKKMAIQVRHESGSIGYILDSKLAMQLFREMCSRPCGRHISRPKAYTGSAHHSFSGSDQFVHLITGMGFSPKHVDVLVWNRSGEGDATEADCGEIDKGSAAPELKGSISCAAMMHEIVRVLFELWAFIYPSICVPCFVGVGVLF
ncbi:unnamed protein product [Calypogeia fissa]